MIEMTLDVVCKNIESALEKQEYGEAEKWLWPALDQFYDHPQLLFYSSHIYVRQERYVSAYLASLRSYELAPNGYAAANLGAICRRLNKLDEAVKWLTVATEYDSDNKHAWNNFAAAFVNEGDPWRGIEAGTRALSLDPNFQKARWNRGLLKLEAGDFETGWDDYRAGLASGERMMRSYGKTETSPPFLLDSRSALIHFRETHGRKPRLVIWGEQGIGDEIMFSTIIPDLSEDAEIIFECHPRLINLHKASFSKYVAEFYPTRKESGVIEWAKHTAPIDFKAPMGDLGRFYRRDRQSFKTACETYGPLFKPETELAATFDEGLTELAKMAGRENPVRIGFAYTGGIVKTMRWYRTVDPMLLAPILMHPDVMPISLQYEDEGPSLDAFKQRFGQPYYSFPSVTQAHDYMNTCALVNSLDCVITVCTSVAHLAAAMGKTTYVLVPQRCAWRYGSNDQENWYWYDFDNVHLLRAKDETGWAPVLEKLKGYLTRDWGIDFESDAARVAERSGAGPLEGAIRFSSGDATGGTVRAFPIPRAIGGVGTGDTAPVRENAGVGE